MSFRKRSIPNSINFCFMCFAAHIDQVHFLIRWINLSFIDFVAMPQQTKLLHCRTSFMSWTKMLIQMITWTVHRILTKGTWTTNLIFLTPSNSYLFACTSLLDAPSALLVIFSKYMTTLPTLSSVHRCIRWKICQNYSQKFVKQKLIIDL